MVAAAVLVAGGGLAYFKAGLQRSPNQSSRSMYENGSVEVPDSNSVDSKKWATTRKQKRGGIKNVKLLAVILLQHIGKRGIKEFLALATIGVSALCFCLKGGLLISGLFGYESLQACDLGYDIGAGNENNTGQPTCQSSGFAVPCSFFDTGSVVYAAHNRKPAPLFSSVSFSIYHKVFDWYYKPTFSQDSH